MKQIRKILFVAEAVTLAQVVRLAALARALEGGPYELHFASAQFAPMVFDRLAVHRWPLFSISPTAAERSMRRGTRLYARRTLERYVADDLRVLDAMRPDVVIGDFRWSLAVSAPLRRVPVLALANAYWRTDVFPVPEHPLVSLLGLARAAPGYARARPFVFRWFAQPLNALREKHGLAPIGSLERVVTWGDVTLFADPPALFPGVEGRFLGPVLWSPDAPMPARLAGPERPLVYVTLGSSGDVRVLPIVLEALSRLAVDVLVATAGRTPLPRGVRSAEFVPGDIAAREAAVVVTNGGSSTGYQALAQGTPVVGLPFNLDQYLAMRAICAMGAGVEVRSGTATAAAVRAAVERAYGMRETARSLAPAFHALDAGAELRRAIDEVTA